VPYDLLWQAPAKTRGRDVAAEVASGTDPITESRKYSSKPVLRHKSATRLFYHGKEFGLEKGF
jgi:hypothetical protein